MLRARSRESGLDWAEGVGLEEAGFIGPAGQKMFACLHRPARPAAAGILICCPFQAEFLENYRKEVLLGRTLAAQGVAVMRFHYRGTGHSGGKPEQCTFDTMVEDARAALDDLQARVGMERVGVLGTRLGALVATAIAAPLWGAPLVLWEPVIEPTRYFREVIRARRIFELKQGVSDPRAGEGLLAELEDGGVLDVFGFSIHGALYRSMSGRSLSGELGGAARPILLVRLAEGRQASRAHAALVAAWTSAGFPVDVRSLDGQQTSWFADELWQTEERRASTRALVRSTADWFAHALGVTAGA